MTDRSTQSSAFDMDELITKGEEIYFQKKDRLEKTKYGQYAIIEVDSKKIYTDKDELTAIKKARAKHPDKLFYIVQIGQLKAHMREVNEVKKDGWTFRR